MQRFLDYSYFWIINTHFYSDYSERVLKEIPYLLDENSKISQNIANPMHFVVDNGEFLKIRSNFL